MRTPPVSVARLGRLTPFAVVALGTLAVVVGAGGTRTTQPTLSSNAAAWRGLAGSARPQVDVGQRVIVVLKAPSLAERVAQAGGPAAGPQERDAAAPALAPPHAAPGTRADH